MKFNVKAVAASVLFAVAGGAQADIISGFDSPVTETGGNDGELFISIFRDDPLSPESMIIDTNLSLFDLRDGVITGWTSDAATTAAVLAFLGTSDISNFVFNAGGVTMVNLNDAIMDPVAYNPDEAFFMTTNDDVAGFVNLQSLNTARSNTNTYIVTINNAFNGDVITGITSASNAFHDNTGLWSSNIGGGIGTLANTEGAVGVDLALWNVYNGSDELFGYLPETALIGFLSIDTTTGVVSFGEGGSEVPVPAAVWLLGSGLVGLVGVARRRSNKA